MSKKQKKRKGKNNEWFDDNCPICRLMREKGEKATFEETMKAFEETKKIPGAIVGTGEDLDKLDKLH